MYKLSDLTRSTVDFDQYAHTYTAADGSSLTGVTAVLKAVLFTDKYKGVDESVLAKAAEHGTRIHTQCRQADLFPDGVYEPEVNGYLTLKSENHITTIANEFLVSIESEGIASSIDMVDNELNLYDIKTTYTLDKEYVSWQLSFYAYMIELQTGLPAGKLYAIWLRGGIYELVEVQRKSAGQVEEVIKAFHEGRTLTKTDNTELGDIVTIETQIKELKDAVRELEARRDELLTPVTHNMTELGLNTLTNDFIKITIIPDSVTTRLNNRLFQQEQPELFKKYTEESTRKGYTKITLL